MKKFNWMIYAVTALLGLLILVFPDFWIKLVVFSVGLGSIAYGGYSLLITRKVFQDSAYETVVLTKGLFSIVIGVIAVIFPLAFAATMWKAMIYIQIVYLLISAVIGFYSVSLLKNTEINRKPYIFENLGLVVLAVVLLFISPERMGIFLVRVIGLAALVFGVVMVSFQFLIEKSTIEVDPDDVEIVDSPEPEKKKSRKVRKMEEASDSEKSE